MPLRHVLLTTWIFLILVIPFTFSSNSLSANKPIEFWKEFEVVEEDSEPQQLIDTKYVPTWESLDKRPLPSWYDSDKIGIFIHWGVFSVPAYDGAWFWHAWRNDKNPKLVKFMEDNYPPRFTYQDFGSQFTAEFYQPEKWASLFAKAGAKYVVLTSKHHEGFTMWPSKYNFGWNSMDIGPKRDLLGELATAIRANTTLRFGLYHSLYEWFHPLYLFDEKNNFTTTNFVNTKSMPELYELVNTYKPEVIWSDGDWVASVEYWQSREFLTWLYNDSPVKDTVVTNDRWGPGCGCKHGGYMTCFDRYNPGVLQPFKWENAMTLDRHFWANRRDTQIEDYLTPEELITTLVETVSCGGNILINVGPTKEGMIVPVQEERLLQLGEWLGVNGDAIYETVPWKAQKDKVTPGVWYTSRPAENKVFALVLKWPEFQITLGSVEGDAVESVELLGVGGYLKWTPDLTGIVVKMPDLELTKARWAWTIQINLKT